MAFLKKLFTRSKPRSSPRKAFKKARKNANKWLETQAGRNNRENPNPPRGSTESAETDPSSDLATVLDHTLFPQTMQQGTEHLGIASNVHLGVKSSGDSRYPRNPSATPGTPPGLPTPPHFGNRPPHPLMQHSRPVPAKPRLSAREVQRSNHDARKQMTDLGYEHDRSDELTPSLMALSETERIKARTYMCYFNMKYKLAYASFRSYAISDSVKMHYQKQLKLSRGVFKASHDYNYTMNKRRRDANTKEARYKHVGTNVIRTLSRTEPESINDENKARYTFICQPHVLQLRNYLETQTQEQRHIKTATGDIFEVNDYAWRSAKARRAWLLRSEERLQTRIQEKRRDSLEGDGKSETTSNERENRRRVVQSLAAKRLHSSLNAEESTRLQTLLKDSFSGDQARNDMLESHPRIVHSVPKPENGALPDYGSGSEYSDSDDSSDDSDAGEINVYDWSEGEQDGAKMFDDLPEDSPGQLEPDTARAVRVMRAGSKVNMYTLTKGSASQDTIMPPQ